MVETKVKDGRKMVFKDNVYVCDIPVEEQRKSVFDGMSRKEIEKMTKDAIVDIIIKEKK